MATNQTHFWQFEIITSRGRREVGFTNWNKVAEALWVRLHDGSCPGWVGNSGVGDYDLKKDTAHAGPPEYFKEKYVTKKRE
jgi:hypothetical protein